MQWFVKQEQVLLITIWQAMFALSNLIASLLAYAFYQLGGSTGDRTGGLYPWQWMSICIAFLSVIASSEAFTCRKDAAEFSCRVGVPSRLAGEGALGH